MSYWKKILQLYGLAWWKVRPLGSESQKRKGVKGSNKAQKSRKAGTQLEFLLHQKSMTIVRMFIQIVKMSIQISKLKKEVNALRQ